MWKVYSSLSKSYLVTQKKYEAQFSSYMPIQTLYWNSLNAEKKKINKHPAAFHEVRY